MYRIMTPDGWLWYLIECDIPQGKVTREWVYALCRDNGVNPFDLAHGIWHNIG